MTSERTSTGHPDVPRGPAEQQHTEFSPGQNGGFNRTPRCHPSLILFGSLEWVHHRDATTPNQNTKEGYRLGSGHSSPNHGVDHVTFWPPYSPQRYHPPRHKDPTARRYRQKIIDDNAARRIYNPIPRHDVGQLMTNKPRIPTLASPPHNFTHRPKLKYAIARGIWLSTIAAGSDIASDALSPARPGSNKSNLI